MQYYPPHAHSFFFGRLRREECEPILRKRGCQDGLFLLREKLEEPGEYVLSMCYQNQFKHYIFERKKNKNLQLGNSSQFIGPIELIHFLMRTDVGLACRPIIECKRFANTEAVHYLFVENRSFLDAVDKQIRFRCKEEEIDDARGRLRYIYEKYAIKDIHLTQRWYRKNTNKEITEELFKENGYADGKFLLRSNRLMKYKLSLCFQNTIYHYRINYNDNRYSIEGSVGKEFEYLIHLIDYYGREEGYLKCVLTMPFNVNFSLKQTYFCDTNNYYRAFISDNENLIKAGRLISDEITFSDLIFKVPNATFLGKLGEGYYSKVYKALYRPKNGIDEIQVAIKVLKEKNEDLINEAKIMSKFDHVNIVKVIEGPEMLEENLRNSVIILEYAEIGPIGTYLKDNEKNLKITQMFLMIEQIASALVYISERKHIHRDIAARNVLVFSKNLVKISDFGLSRKLDDYEYYNMQNVIPMPVKWYPPEVLKYKKFSEKSDVWSFGVLLWEIFTFGGHPHGMRRITCNADLEEFIRDMLSGKCILEKPDKCPDEVYDLMKECWNIDYNLRPCFKEILDIIRSLDNQYKLYETHL